MTDFKTIPWWRLGRKLRAVREIEDELQRFGESIERTLASLPDSIRAPTSERSESHAGMVHAADPI